MKRPLDVEIIESKNRDWYSSIVKARQFLNGKLAKVGMVIYTGYVHFMDWSGPVHLLRRGETKTDTSFRLKANVEYMNRY